jgi:low temperature requirement protein LtrA
LPEAFGERGLLFALALAALQLGRTMFIVIWTRRDPVLGPNFQRIFAWLIASSIFWIAGGLSSGTTRELIWLCAIAIDLVAPAAGYWTPGLGRSSTHDWNISGGHMAERCQLFLIIALGESILVTGATFGEMEITSSVLAAFIIAFLGSVALWWVYFDRAAGDAEHLIAQSDDPGRLGRLAYTYLHIPMVAGIIVTAVGDELAIAHPLGHAGPGIAATVLGGPAIFLFGHLLFKRAVFEVWSLPRIAAIIILLIVAFVGQELPPIALASISLVVIASVPVMDAVTGHDGRAGFARR